MHLVQYLHAFDTSDGTSTWSRTTTTDAASPDQSTYSAQRYTVTCLSYISISRAQGRLGLRVLGARRRLAYAEPAIEEVSRVTCIVACFGFFFSPRASCTTAFTGPAPRTSNLTRLEEKGFSSQRLAPYQYSWNAGVEVRKAVVLVKVNADMQR